MATKSIDGYFDLYAYAVPNLPGMATGVAYVIGGFDNETAKVKGSIVMFSHYADMIAFLGDRPCGILPTCETYRALEGNA